jgi:hypothetical protein
LLQTQSVEAGGFLVRAFRDSGQAVAQSHQQHPVRFDAGIHSASRLAPGPAVRPPVQEQASSSNLVAQPCRSASATQEVIGD